MPMLNSPLLGIGLTVVLAGLGVLADLALKVSGQGPGYVRPFWFICGALLYMLTAGGWFLVMKETKLVTLGAVYPLVTMVLLTAAGVLLFRERLSTSELAGLLTAAISIGLLTRFG